MLQTRRYFLILFLPGNGDAPPPTAPWTSGFINLETNTITVLNVFLFCFLAILVPSCNWQKFTYFLRKTILYFWLLVKRGGTYPLGAVSFFLNFAKRRM